MAKKKKATAKEKRAMTLQARIDAAKENEAKRQLKEYKESAAPTPEAEPAPEPVLEQAPGTGTMTGIPGTTPEPETKAASEPVLRARPGRASRGTRKPSKVSILKPSDPEERADGRNVCTISLIMRMTLEELMKTLRKEYPEDTGSVFIRTDGQGCLEAGPHMTYAYDKGLFLRQDPLSGKAAKNRTQYLLADLLSQPVKSIQCEPVENGIDWYITLSPASAEAAQEA